MSSRTSAHALSSDAFFFKLGGGATTENWMAGGATEDVVDELRKEGHVTDRQYVAVRRFLDDMRKAHGSSGGIVPQYGERVQSSLRERMAPPGGGDPDAFVRMNRVLTGLREHERQLLGYLIVKRELPRGSLTDRGRMTSGYSNGKTARAFTTGQIRALFESIAELQAAAKLEVTGVSRMHLSGALTSP